MIPSILPALAPFTFLCREVWPSYELIQKLPPSMPVLFLSGEKDEVVPRPHMVELHRTCPSENKEWHSFPDGTHNDTCVKPKYFDIIAAFLLKYLTPCTTPRTKRTTTGSRWAPAMWMPPSVLASRWAAFAT